VTNTEAERLLFEFVLRQLEPDLNFNGAMWGVTWLYDDYAVECMWTGWLLAKGQKS
jgi:hypothetical protein